MSRFAMNAAPAKAEQSFIFGDVRLSVISHRILRIEKAPLGRFCDKASQMAVCRDFCTAPVTVTEKGSTVILKTEQGAFRVNLTTLAAEAKIGSRWVLPTNQTNMGGTARTLDGTFGVLGSWKTKKEKKDHFCFGHLRKGIFATSGAAEIDDSKSFLFNEDGSVCLREKGTTDKYIFAFGDDYLGGLKEFYLLCGQTPVLPKYALGNWWSRYHAYSADEYTGLMTEFQKRGIPFTVATIDMDWHKVKNIPRDIKPTIIQGAGWTGYTFEESLFPDYKAFFRDLKSRGLAVTMNLHPHDGVRYFEKQYKEMCEACGQNPETKEPVRFNLTDPTFTNAYFDILHHPYEEDGVDFWWIDWQQGTSSPLMMGLDPLWLLNHYHFNDICRNGNTGMILSRYAGLGSHRYPVGFSGDTYVCWKSLDLQPWFTANASNAGYTWWSHDIGGHIGSVGQNEIYLRWVQYGVFSPINRLHSNNKSLSKEPWHYPKAEKIAVDFLRLRHRLLPYLYTANVLTANEGLPLVCPMYYYDKSPLAYDEKYRNQYYFGGQLIVAPVTEPTKKNRCNVRFYLPEGQWTNVFTGKTYEGGEYTMHCDWEHYPVFAKAGAIVPLLPESEGNSTDFAALDVAAYYGCGEYTLFDDDGETVHFALNGDSLTVTPSAGSRVKTVTVHYINSEKADEVFTF